MSDGRFAPPGPEDAGDRYRNLRTVAEDSSGRYLVGEDAASAERVVMVVARPVSVLTSSTSSAHAESRLAQARVAAETKIPGIAPVRSLGRTAGGHPFEVSGLGDGLLLSETASDDDLSLDRAVRIGGVIANVLASAHAAGIVHGSVSPHTIVVPRDVDSAGLHGFGISSPWVPVEEGPRGVGPVDQRDAPHDAEWLDVLARDDVRALARVLRTILEDGSRSDAGAALAVPPVLLALLARAESDSSMSAAEFAKSLRAVVPSGSDLPDPDGEYGPIAAPPSRRRERRIAGVLMAVAALLALIVVLGRADRATEPTLEDQLAEANAAPGDEGRAPDEVAADRPQDDAKVDPAITTDRRVAQAPRPREESFGAVERAPVGSTASRSAQDPGSPAARSPNASRDGSARPAAGDPLRMATVPSGTGITLAARERVCTNTHSPGDSFSATVTTPAGNDAIIPAGSSAVVQVSSVERAETAGEPPRLGLLVQQIVIEGQRYPIDASITRVQVDQQRAASRESDAQKVIGGAIAGAILGQVLGKDTKSTVIGAATGAAAGTVIAMQSGDRDGCIPAGGTIAIRLNTPARVASR